MEIGWFQGILPEKALFRPSEAAAYLSISVKTIYLWIETGKLEGFRVGDKLLRIPREEILRVMRSYGD